MLRMRLLQAGLALLTLAPTLAAQQAPPGCDTPEFRQFDFWVGDWIVMLPNGQQAGTNLVTLEEDGCVVHEHWKGAGGSTGQSFNFFDRIRRQWRQLWVDNAGNVLEFAGAYAEGRMALTGTSTDRQGRAVRHRLTFFRNSDGTVRQLWESSSDAGDSWSVAFDGLYRKRAP